ncbi:MAG TPA: DUF6204 family protein [Acidimicrobiales bacterium]
MRIFRVTVRGWFDGLDDERRAALLAVADDHDVVSVGAYTEAGTLTYERSLHTFTFRVQLRAEGDDAEAEVLERATALATDRLADLGAGHRDVRANAKDMASIWS